MSPYIMPGGTTTPSMHTLEQACCNQCGLNLPSLPSALVYLSVAVHTGQGCAKNDVLKTKKCETSNERVRE